MSVEARSSTGGGPLAPYGSFRIEAGHGVFNQHAENRKATVEKFCRLTLQGDWYRPIM